MIGLISGMVMLALVAKGEMSFWQLTLMISSPEGAQFEQIATFATPGACEREARRQARGTFEALENVQRKTGSPGVRRRMDSPVVMESIRPDGSVVLSVWSCEPVQEAPTQQW
jgi:hypothetical protein